MTTTTYTIHDYSDGRAIGEIEMTPAQVRRYMADAQQLEGLVTAEYVRQLGHAEYSVVLPDSATVYLKE